MRAIGNAAHVQLLRLLRERLAPPPGFEAWQVESGRPWLAVEDFACEPWASLTFSGARHRLTVRLSGEREAVEAAYARLRSLARDERTALTGHFLAGIELEESEGVIDGAGQMDLMVRIGMLTIEE